MSEAPATTARRAPRKRTNKPRTPRAEGEEEKAPRERKERPETVAVPEALVSTVVFGRVCDVISRGRDKFGFIYITPKDHVAGPDDTKNQFQGFQQFPRIYFNVAEYKETDFKIRKNDLVTFTVKKDDKERAFASEITLTPAGREEAAKKEAALAALPPREPRVAGDKAASPRPRRERKERVIDERTLNLKCTCVDNAGVTKDIVAVLGESIGKLKHTGITAFEARTELNVFYKGELLTKAVLLAMAEGETIHLGEPVAKTA